MNEVIANVVCASCLWKGRRKTGRIVYCPRCGKCACFDIQTPQERKAEKERVLQAFDIKCQKCGDKNELSLDIDAFDLICSKCRRLA